MLMNEGKYVHVNDSNYDSLGHSDLDAAHFLPGNGRWWTHLGSALRSNMIQIIGFSTAVYGSAGQYP